MEDCQQGNFFFSIQKVCQLQPQAKLTTAEVNAATKQTSSYGKQVKAFRLFGEKLNY